MNNAEINQENIDICKNSRNLKKGEIKKYNSNSKIGCSRKSFYFILFSFYY